MAGSIVPNAAEGDRGAGRLAFAEIHARFFDFVWASLRGLGVPASAVDDATQDVFVVLHRRLPDFEGRSTLKTFVFGIVIGTARNYRRSAMRRHRVFGLAGFDDIAEVQDLADARPSPFDGAASSEALSRLVSILDRMDDAKREVLVLAEWEEMSAPEIAEALGIGVNTVYSRLRLARAEFERLLSEDREGAR
jgi:RNA polymerase sigma-70 factor (ECF subfamily)